MSKRSFKNLILKGVLEPPEPERAAEAREAHRSGEFFKKQHMNIFSVQFKIMEPNSKIISGATSKYVLLTITEICHVENRQGKESPW